MIKKILTYTGGALLLLTVTLFALFNKEAIQLYRVITLFYEDNIVENFSRAHTLIDSVTIERTGPVNPLGSAPQPLPETFNHNGEDLNLNQWLQDSSATALVVVHGDDITYQDYYQGTAEFDQRISWSMAKSYLSALFGIAIEEGFIDSIEESVSDYVPELIGTGYEGVRIKDVLQMSSGIHFNEDYGDFNSDINRFGRILAIGGSFDKFAASFQRNREPGTYMHYVSMDTHVIGMVLRAATGREIVDYFDEKLWSHLGTERDALYIVDSQNQPMVLGGLNIISRDYARFGQLYRDNGRISGKQIVPEQWIQDSVTPDAPHLMPGKRDSSDTTLGYGYQWWVPEQADGEFMALGIYGQYIYINQKANVVIVKNSADIGFMDNDYQSKDYAISAFRAITASLLETNLATAVQ